MKQHLKIKVCGMRQEKNIKELDSLDIDFLGLIFYEKSLRFVEGFAPETKAKKIGVFVNAKKEYIIEQSKKYELSFIQLHGDETPEFCKTLKNKGLRIMKAFRVDDEFNFELIKEHEAHCEYFLFDAKGKDYGGNGIVFNWNVLDKYKGKLPFFLSGGISMDSIESIKEFHHNKLYALDVNSGFEIKPALKNIELIKEFIEEINI